MKNYRRLIEETETRIFISKDIEVPGVECVLIERIVKSDPFEAHYKYQVYYQITHEDGRTYTAKYSRYISTYGPSTSIGTTCYIKTEFP